MDAARLEERPVVVDAPLCSRFRTPRSACVTCAELCPTGAIRIADRGAEIVGTCHGCGVCFAACPNGAFRISGKNDQTVLSTIRDRCASPPATFRIRCARGDAPADLVVPCLGRLTEVLLLEPLRLGASATEILEPPCEACPSARGVAELPNLLRRARSLAELVGRGREAVREQRVPLRGHPERRERPVTRRDFLRAMRGQAAGPAATSLAEEPGRDGKGGSSFRDLLEQRRESVKRSLLLDCLRRFPSRDCGTREVPSPSPVAVPSREAPLAELTVTPRCTGCGVCATLCPTGAITANWTERDFVLSFRPWDCTNCQVCVIVCGPRAIRARGTVRLDSLLRAQAVPLLQARRATCRLCRDAFPADGSDICPLCTHQQKRQAAALHILFKEPAP